MAPPRSTDVGAAGRASPLSYATVFQGWTNTNVLKNIKVLKCQTQTFVSAFPRIGHVSTPELNRRLLVPYGHPPVTSSATFRDLYLEGRSLVK